LLATSKKPRDAPNRQHPANTATSLATTHQPIAERRKVSDSRERGPAVDVASVTKIPVKSSKRSCGSSRGVEKAGSTRSGWMV
jgi:hypothetical protein